MPMPGAGAKRNRLQGAPPQWADVRSLLHMRLKDAAAELNVPITYLRRLCRQNGFPAWPGKKIRYMNSTGRNLMMLGDGSPWAGWLLAAAPSQLLLAKIPKSKKKKEGDEPVANHPPAKELTTLNLIDKVGSSSSSGSERS